MIYPADFEKKIGFDAIRARLSSLCLSPLGVRYVEAMSFMTDRAEVEKALLLTDEMLAIILSGAQLPTDNIHDMTEALRRIKAEGSFLTARELYQIRTSLRTIAQVRDFFTLTDDEGKVRAPKLAEEFKDLQTFSNIERLIDSVINKFGEVADNASVALADIRRSISSATAKLSTVMRRVIERAAAAGIVDSATTPSMRDGRLVIPVEAAKKRSIPGIVHDESATGKTSYVEPVEVVAASNRLRELEEEEKREVHRILVSVANELRPYIPEISESYELLGYYDFLRAKGLLAEEFDAHMPSIEKKCEMEWYGAVHPVLAMTLKKQGKKVVPLDLPLSGEKRILLISGPNAGGKSVCLKTTGIVQYMLQCGLLPTLYSNSHVCLFDNIFIDIGDEQSLENDLSTYSSHLRNMKAFMRSATPRTLILVDEMGSGTEPQIGGALAQAILVQLNKDKVRGVVTTHYQNLKTFADHTPGFVNGAMLYDRQKMEPMFKLAVGNPGSSFALEIAHKIGLPNQVIADAKEIVGSDIVNMDKYLLDIARDRRYWQNKRQNIKEKESKLEKLVDKYEEEVSDLRRQRREILTKAREEASEILSTTNKQVERTILEIRTAQAEKERTKEIRRELDEYKKQVHHLNVDDSKLPGLKSQLPKKPAPRKEVTPEAKPEKKQEQIAVDSYVRMTKGGTVGKVLAINGKNAEVAFGALRMRVPVSKLTAAVEPVKKATEQTLSISRTTSDDSRRRQLDFKTDIDLRGMRADEALQTVTYFLDDAQQFGIGRVRILHGTGTGALRMAIRQFLQSVPWVTSFRDEDVRFGGAGITVVDLE